MSLAALMGMANDPAVKTSVESLMRVGVTLDALILRLDRIEAKLDELMRCEGISPRHVLPAGIGVDGI